MRIGVKRAVKFFLSPARNLVPTHGFVLVVVVGLFAVL